MKRKKKVSDTVEAAYHKQTIYAEHHVEAG